MLSTLLTLGLALSQIATAIPLSKRQTSSDCASGVHIILAGGNGTTDGNGYLQDLVTTIENQYPGTDEYVVPYDGSAMPAPAATNAMEQAIEQYAVSCPDTPIVLLGYSLGGIVVMNNLCGGIGPGYTNNILAAIAYGEETRVAGEPYDEGTCPNSAPHYARSDPSTCDTYAAAIQSYCDAPDPECCAGGNDPDVHFQYSKYDQQALQFIESRKASFTGAQGTTGVTGDAGGTDPAPEPAPAPPTDPAPAPEPILGLPGVAPPTIPGVGGILKGREAEAIEFEA